MSYCILIMKNIIHWEKISAELSIICLSGTISDQAMDMRLGMISSSGSLSNFVVVFYCLVLLHGKVVSSLFIYLFFEFCF